MSDQPNKTEDQEFAEARERQWLWKTKQMQDMAAMLVKVALERDEFSANDLPKDMDHGGRGIAGSITKVLEGAKIIKKAGAWMGSTFYPKLTGRTRVGGHGSKLFVWTLANRSLAVAFLKANHKFKEARQAQLEIAA